MSCDDGQHYKEVPTYKCPVVLCLFRQPLLRQSDYVTVMQHRLGHIMAETRCKHDVPLRTPCAKCFQEVLDRVEFTSEAVVTQAEIIVRQHQQEV